MTIFRYKILNSIEPIRVSLGDLLFDNLRKLSPGANVFHLLSHIPEQYEDIFVVLVNDSEVISFEMDRDTGCVGEVRTVHAETYRRSLRGRAAKEFKVSIEAAQTELRKQQ
jgi:hypothetical protein